MKKLSLNNENKFIENWKKAVEMLKKSYEMQAEILNQQNPFDLKAFAQRQLELCNESRPNKELTMREQANSYQNEYFDYLEKVIETGEL